MKSRWLRFSFRTLLVLVTVCAITAGTLTIYVRPYIAEYEQEQQTLTYFQEARGAVDTALEPRGPGWLQWFRDGEYAERVTFLSVKGPEFTSEDWEKLRDFPFLENLGVSNAPPVTDTQLAESLSTPAFSALSLQDTSVRNTGNHALRTVSNLTRLAILNREFTADDAAWIADLPNLEKLSIYAPVTNDHLKQIGGLSSLQHLAIYGNRITDEGLVHLEALTRLKVLVLEGCTATDAGMKHLTSLRALERLRIKSWSQQGQYFDSLANPVLAHFIDLPLRDAIFELNRRKSVPLLFDEAELADAGIELNKRLVNMNERGITMREAIEKLLKPHGLVGVVSEEGLVITTEDAAARRRPGITQLQKVLPNLDVEVSW